MHNIFVGFADTLYTELQNKTRRRATMRRIPIDQLQKGDIIGQPLYDDQGRILLKAGIVLTDRLKEKIIAMDLKSIYIADSFEDVGSLTDIISPSIRQDAISAVKNIYDAFVSDESRRNKVSAQRKNFQENEHIIKLNDTVEAILTEVFSNKSALIEMVDIKKADNYLYGHAVNTAVLSLLIGLEMHLNERDLKRVVIACLLMNIGNKLLDEKLLDKAGPLSFEEIKVMQSHVLLGFEFIRENSDVPIHIRNLILQHHERINGTGYPHGLRGDSIDKLARIIAIADTYDALTSDRPHRPAYPPSEALEKIMSDAGILFDFEIVNLFAKRVIAFPNGTFVKLSNGDLAEVIASNKDIPLRPVVEILKHSSKNENYMTLDLKRELSVVIEEVVFRID
jgi:HD-GYP domain-containing protein (c-di-GMP phosphodiesterase class II)